VHYPQLNSLDRRIWDEELDAFCPARIFDVHTHSYRWDFNLDPNRDQGPYSKIGENYPNADWQALVECDRRLLPGRTVERLVFPFPFSPRCDFEAANRFVAKQISQHVRSGALMLVHPLMSAEYVEEQVRKHGFLGLKPYRTYSSTGDAVECRITDFLPRHQIAVANRMGLIIMMHLAKRDAIADPQNLADLLELSGEYAKSQWILAHCARSYSAWAIEEAAPHLRDLKNVWYDTSSVCESDSFDALFSTVGADRVMYGSDDAPVGVSRGKYVAFGRAWSFLSETNHSLELSHCDGRMTFTRYEQLRAMRRAALRVGLTSQQIEELFYFTASRLINKVQEGRQAHEIPQPHGKLTVRHHS
jgi:predicted TIM-barrel fold metal-dependent hydrolase